MKIRMHLGVLLASISWASLALGQTAESARLAPENNAATYYRQAWGKMPTLQNAAHFAPVWDQGIDKVSPKLAANYVQHIEPVMEFLHRGAALPQVDWGLPQIPTIDTAFPHLGQARMISSAACDHAWHMSQHGDFDQARQDWLDVLRLSRHVAQDGPLISALVAWSLENMVHNRLAQVISRGTPLQLQLLEKDLDQLPPSASAVFALHGEQRCVIETIRAQTQNPSPAATRSKPAADQPPSTLPEDPFAAWKQLARDHPEEFNQCLLELQEHYQKAIIIAALPWHQFVAESQRFEQDIRNHPHQKYLATVLLQIMPVIGTEHATRVRTVMVRAAIAYRLQGKAGFETIKDPSTNQPFTAFPTPAGLEIRSTFILHQDTGKKSTLTFPGLKFEP